MVQKSVPSKLGIQANDLIKSQSFSKKLKTTSCNHQQDIKTIKKPDMKKKMKRSGSIKLPDTKSLTSPLKNPLLGPGRPPPHRAPSPLSTPRKQPILKPPDGSPNYMKSTTSSAARKEERLQFQVSSDGKNSRQRCSSSSKRTSDSNDKSTSLKLARSLTRTPSFKQGRGSSKKSCSRVVLCAHDDIRTATCSSTLKDLKFPNYLLLNPGGTEAEGTSVMKVCPYTYCSLNGHHHDPLPPLKCFLKVRRQSMKVQKSVKLEVLAPRRAKTLTVRGEDTGLIFSSGGKSAEKEVDSVIQGAGVDFLVEIYTKSQENGFETIHKSIDKDDMETTEVPEKSGDLCSGDNSIDSSSPNLDVASVRYIKQHGANDFEVMDFTGCFLGQSIAQDVDVDGATKLSEKEAIKEGVDGGSGQAFIERDYRSSLDGDDDISESAEMEWEEGQLSHLEIDAEADYNPPQKFDLEGETELSESDDNLSNCAVEIQADDFLKELFEEETESSASGCNESNSETCEDFECSKMTTDQFPSAEATTINETYTDADTDSFPAATNSDLKLEPSMEMIATEENVQEDAICEAEKDIVEAIQNQIVDFQDSNERCEAKTDDIQSESQNPDDVESDQSVANGVSSLEEFIKTGEAAEAIGNEMQEANGELLSDNKICNSPGIDQSIAVLNGDKEVSDTSNSTKWSVRRKKSGEDIEEERKFNPREPNFLPIIPDPDAEKVDLKHQEMDDRKNSEEWMLDYALRQTVTKLAPARKRKVALLVEAFETVLPVPKYEAHHIRHAPASSFSHTRTIQACS